VLGFYKVPTGVYVAVMILPTKLPKVKIFNNWRFTNSKQKLDHQEINNQWFKIYSLCT
jgi:hypothetical protein